MLDLYGEAFLPSVSKWARGYNDRTMGEPNNGRRLSAGERADQLMDVALELFIDNGYADTSMESVAQAAGVTKPVIYTYFRSKEELYTDVLKRQQDLFTRARQDDVGNDFSTTDPEVTVRKVYEALFRGAAEEPGLHRFLYGEYRGAPRMFAEQQEAWRVVHLERMAAFFESFFTQLDGEDRKAAGHAVAISMSSIGRYGIRMVMENPGQHDPDRLAEILSVTVVRGIPGLQLTEGGGSSLGPAPGHAPEAQGTTWGATQRA